MFQSPLTNGAYALPLALFHTLALVYQYNLFLLLRKLKYLHFNIAKYATIFLSIFLLSYESFYTFNNKNNGKNFHYERKTKLEPVAPDNSRKILCNKLDF